MDRALDGPRLCCVPGAVPYGVWTVLGPDGRSEPWLQAFTDHPAVASIIGWPREVLPVL